MHRKLLSASQAVASFLEEGPSTIQTLKDTNETPNGKVYYNLKDGERVLRVPTKYK